MVHGVEPSMGTAMKKIDRQSTRNRRRSGTGILEMGFLLMPTFALIGGFVDIGMALFTWNTLQNAVREGTRYAITYQVDSSGHHATAPGGGAMQAAEDVRPPVQSARRATNKVNKCVRNPRGW